MNALTITAGPMSPALQLPRSLRRLKTLLEPLFMAITTAMCTSYKVELMTATHNHAVGGSNFKLALFDSTATMDATTTTYSGANEVANGSGYTTGGKALTNSAPTSSGTTAYTTFTDLVWTASTFTTRGAQIFNNSAANKSVGVFDFGANISVSAGNLTVQFPTANATAAVLRLA
jgi:hypothetical protein